jgi:hypothetical protein
MSDAHNVYLQLKRMETAMTRYVQMQRERDETLAKTFGMLIVMLDNKELDKMGNMLLDMYNFYMDRMKGK